MSIKVMSMIWDRGPQNTNDRFVLLALADFANDEGECWPSMAGIARKTCMSERGVRKIIRRLEDIGWLSVSVGNGRKNCNLYTIRNPEPRSPRNPVPPEQQSINPEPRSLNPEPRSAEPSRTIKEPSVIDQTFEDWWDICPRKIGKGAARKAFEKALKTTDEATLFLAMRSHAEAMADKDTQYIPHPSTWLNQERWTDEHEAKGADFYRNFDAMLKGTDNGLQLTNARNSGEGKSISSPELQTARAHGQRSEGGADQADSGNDQQAYICAIKPRRFGGSR